MVSHGTTNSSFAEREKKTQTHWIRNASICALGMAIWYVIILLTLTLHFLFFSTLLICVPQFFFVAFSRSVWYTAICASCFIILFQQIVFDYPHFTPLPASYKLKQNSRVSKHDESRERMRGRERDANRKKIRKTRVNVFSVWIWCAWRQIIIWARVYGVWVCACVYICECVRARRMC